MDAPAGPRLHGRRHDTAPSRSARSNCAAPSRCSTFACSPIPTFATGAADITVFFLSMFGFFFVVMQYMQLILGYSAIKTAFALSPIMGPMLCCRCCRSGTCRGSGCASSSFRPDVDLRRTGVPARRQVGGRRYWDVAWPMIVMSTGIGLCTAPTTSAIMNTAPDDKQGVASAVNDTTREIGAALGIALAGIDAGRHYADVARTTTGGLIPRRYATPRPNSLGQALEVAADSAPQALGSPNSARSAFIDAMDSSLLVLAAVVAWQRRPDRAMGTGARRRPARRIVRRLRTSTGSSGRHRA